MGKTRKGRNKYEEKKASNYNAINVDEHYICRMWKGRGENRREGR